MPRYKLLIEYDGTNYNGWQAQPKGKTVEDEIEKALSRILRKPIDVVGQGRTDSGVHAEGQVAHFDYDENLNKEELLFALLGVLPGDIAAWDLEEVSGDFHARFDARARAYRFQIVTRPSPLLRPYSEMILEGLDLDRMMDCAGLIMGTHDFESFTKSGEEQPETECTIIESEFEVNRHLVTYRVKANRFLRHMVRRLVGSMYQVGRGKWSPGRFDELLTNPSRKHSGHGAAARGLILEKVEY